MTTIEKTADASGVALTGELECWRRRMVTALCEAADIAKEGGFHALAETLRHNYAAAFDDTIEARFQPTLKQAFEMGNADVASTIERRIRDEQHRAYSLGYGAAKRRYKQSND